MGHFIEGFERIRSPEAKAVFGNLHQQAV